MLEDISEIMKPLTASVKTAKEKLKAASAESGKLKLSVKLKLKCPNENFLESIRLNVV